MARKRRKNPELFTPTNLLIAAGIGVGVWLVVRELRKRGLLGNGDYGVKPAQKPAPKPKVTTTYSPQITYRIEKAAKLAPKQTGGPMYEVKRAVGEIQRFEAALPQARAGITKATAELQAALEASRKLKAPQGSPKALEAVERMLVADAKVKAAQAEYENSPLKKSLDYAYQQARRAATQTVSNQDALKKAYGDERASEIVRELSGALLDTGEEDYVTTEGSVPRSP